MNNQNALPQALALDPICHHCSRQMQKVSWKVTAGAHDVSKEVEQTVYQCPADKQTISIEATTGNPSEFAVDPNDFLSEINQTAN